MKKCVFLPYLHIDTHLQTLLIHGQKALVWDEKRETHIFTHVGPLYMSFFASFFPHLLCPFSINIPTSLFLSVTNFPSSPVLARILLMDESVEWIYL